MQIYCVYEEFVVALLHEVNRKKELSDKKRDVKPTSQNQMKI